MGWRPKKEQSAMKTPWRKTSGPPHIICPGCGSGKLQLQAPELASCDSCALSVRGAIFGTLEQIAALPDVLRSHACECGHPEMRHLPDGVYHCPACGSEVTPISAPVSWKSTDHTEAYWSGWLDEI